MVTTTDDGERQTINLPTAFRMLGISRPVGYELARRDRLPVPVIRIGDRRMVVSRRALEAVLNATKPTDTDDAA
jgi:predicted DNA-binding transcriptional regulator AlpA